MVHRSCLVDTPKHGKTLFEGTIAFGRLILAFPISLGFTLKKSSRELLPRQTANRVVTGWVMMEPAIS